MKKILVAVENHDKAVHYVDALKASGLPVEDIRVFVPEGESVEDLRELAAQAAGLVLCGGPDMDPRRYGEEPREDANLSLDLPLDELDWTLLSGADDGKTPVWAICRGMQTVNVYRGGSLWQDIYSQLPTELGREVIGHDIPDPLHAAAHTIEVTTRDNWLAEALDHDRVEVNSRHHQALKELGDGVIKIAESEDGVLEAMSLEDGDWWVHGVQWHPENLVEHPVHRNLWREFIEVTKILEDEKA